jgi:modulator of FtsH protease
MRMKAWEWNSGIAGVYRMSLNCIKKTQLFFSSSTGLGKIAGRDIIGSGVFYIASYFRRIFIMAQRFQTVNRSGTYVSVQNSVLRNTLILLSASTLFAAFTAYLSFLNPMAAASLGPMVTILLYMGILYSIEMFKNSSLGIGCVFLLTGFLGYTLGPLLHVVFHQIAGGPQIISTSFLGTAMIFGGLSLYASTVKEEMNYLAGFLSISSMSLFALCLMNYLFFQMPFMSIMISCGILLVSSGWLLFNLSRIIQGGERNYITATVVLFVDLYNIFISLIRILSALSSSRDR